MDQTPTPAPEPAACPACGYMTLLPSATGLACTDCDYTHPIPAAAAATLRTRPKT